MSATELNRLHQENAYLKLRCAQLQADVSDLDAQLSRVQNELERLHGRRATAVQANPLAGGQ